MPDSAIEEYDVARRIVENDLKIKALQAQNDELKGYFRQFDTGKTVLEREGEVTLIVKSATNQRIDDKLARAELTDTEYETVSKLSIDSARARAFLSNAQLDKITKKYDNRITIVVE